MRNALRNAGFRQVLGNGWLWQRVDQFGGLEEVLIKPETAVIFTGTGGRAEVSHQALVDMEWWDRL